MTALRPINGLPNLNWYHQWQAGHYQLIEWTTAYMQRRIDEYLIYTSFPLVISYCSNSHLIYVTTLNPECVISIKQETIFHQGIGINSNIQWPGTRNKFIQWLVKARRHVKRQVAAGIFFPGRKLNESRPSPLYVKKSLFTAPGLRNLSITSQVVLGDLENGVRSSLFSANIEF